MPLDVPDPAKEELDARLRAAFERAQARWTRTRDGLPPLPGLCPMKRAKKTAPTRAPADWLSWEFPKMAIEFARRAQAESRVTTELLDAVVSEIATVRFDYARVASTVTALTAAKVGPEKIERREACPLVREYLQPLLDADAYRGWLDEMARTQWFWKSGASTAAAVPLAVRTREYNRDRALMERWHGDPPAGARAAASARMEAFVAHEPTSSQLPIVRFRDGVAPANLFISEVAVSASGYLRAIDPILRIVAGPLGLAGALRGVAYGMVVLALVPVFCLYDNYHGTCVIEELLPRLSNSLAVMAEYARRSLPVKLVPRLQGRLLPEDDGRVVTLLDAFSAFAASLAGATRDSHDRLLHVAADQGGRVRTPKRFTKSGSWTFNIKEGSEDSTLAEHTAPEMLEYPVVKGRRVSSYDESKEIYWILPALWTPVATALALCNQAGMRVWFNAANNRWGGKHPPHDTHRQGASLDVDVGFAWLEGSKVPNVKKRDPQHVPLPDNLVPRNSSNAECLQSMDRIAGWILTQAFLLVGVRYFVYGDWALVEEAAAHLAAQVNIERPARLDGRVDVLGHNDHWHFEMSVGDRASGVDPYLWQASDPDLLSHLYALAVERDKNIAFWRTMAGPLKDPPTQESDFSNVRDAENWQRWWSWGHGSKSEAGLPLLPVWAPAAENLTRGSQTCKKVPEGDFPSSAGVGEMSG